MERKDFQGRTTRENSNGEKGQGGRDPNRRCALFWHDDEKHYNEHIGTDEEGWDMLYTVTGNGCGETLYDNQVIEIEGATEEEVQQWGDEWVASLPDEKRDIYDDLDFAKVGIQEVVEAMPKHWRAHLVGEKGHTLFL